MKIDRRGAMALGMAGLAAARAAKGQPGSSGRPADPAETIHLWPNGAPGGERVRVTAKVTERSTSPEFHDRSAAHTRDPRMMVYRPAKPNGAAMLLIPGGGYRYSVLDKEGTEIALPFSQAGITCFVLLYRLPADGWAAGPDAPLQDAQRALRIIRSRAAEFGVDPKRVGVLGASAGGHLAASLSTGADRNVYAPVDRLDTVPARPDFALLLYPVISLSEPFVHAGSRKELLGVASAAEQIRAYSPNLQVRANTPPTFLVHAYDDGAVPIENSFLYSEALRSAKVPVETHYFEEGGHGFGIRQTKGLPAASWPTLFLNWAGRRGYLGPSASIKTD
ncbi:alpha/beta hydrolase [Allosphingosinicella deserti]|uniref:Alpha/beta hydrolase n=1 Tax=Allosphingosinicella deserti TaxID=2116704 RepID=A0A2P7QYD0_9SPHN|nr:alpha/beta hydrolase [Sphingomonas deserti]PSJ42978.1 alpha/beta hydrolase [Sphingomonas deserti]